MYSLNYIKKGGRRTMELCDFCKKSFTCEINKIERTYFDDEPESYEKFIEAEEKLKKYEDIVQVMVVTYGWGKSLEIYSCKYYEPINDED